jgi:hypothetical protein
MANVKITDLTALSGALVGADLFEMVDDVAGTPASRKVTADVVQDFMLSAFGGGTEVSVTTTATATIGRMHHCTGTSADYTVTLPAASGNTGKLIGFRMGSTTALTKIVTIDGNSSETIDGATTRVMWSNEVAILLCDGSNWFKVAGKSIPMTCFTTRTAAKTGIAKDTETLIEIDTLNSEAPAGQADTGAGRINVKRGSYYTYTAAIIWNLSSASANTQAYPRVNATKTGATALIPTTAAALPGIVNTGKLLLATGDYVELGGRHGCATSQPTLGGGERLILVEDVSW